VILLLIRKKPKDGAKVALVGDSKGVGQAGGKPGVGGAPTASDATASVGEKSYDDYLEEEFSSDSVTEFEVESNEHSDQTDLVEATTVATWEDLPEGGEYLEADGSGTVWYKTAEGEHWYRNDDDSWSIFASDGSE
jgi:hypothetical protein